MMTKKDYIALASELHAAQPVGHGAGKTAALAAAEQHRRDVQAIVAVLRRDNPRFDEARFLTACGL
jgi:hypothetical protein